MRSAPHNGKATPDHLTIHDGQWAYCPQDSRADEHEWQPTGGVRLSDMRAVVRRLKDGSQPLLSSASRAAGA
ncbi:MAG: hypothetical protein E6I51_04255, partial [Chloroflexi bacterium]